MMESNIQVVISAPSGAGKTTLIKKLLSDNPNLEFSISTTTRKMRSEEKPKRSYNFVTIEEFKGMIEKDEFAEWALVHNNYYGTTKKEIDRIFSIGNIPIFDVDVQGGKILKIKLGNPVLIFIIPPSLKILEERLRTRKSESEESIKIRLKNAIDEMKEFENYDYIVMNDNLEIASKQISAIITAEQCRKDRTKSLMSSMEG